MQNTFRRIHTCIPAIALSTCGHDHTACTCAKAFRWVGRHARYSTRELVNLVRHMTAYPEDSMEKVLANFLIFNSFGENVPVKLMKTFATHGLL